MTTANDYTMAASEATGITFKKVERKNKSKRLKTMPVAQNLAQRTHKYVIRIYFPMPRANTTFNVTASMRLFFKEMLNYDSTITITNPTDDKQIQLATDAVPMLEAEFKKLFTITHDTCPTGTKLHIIIGLSHDE